MNLYDTHTMKRGAILVDVCGYTGEEDFYAMHKIIDEVIKPGGFRLQRGFHVYRRLF